jgi:hypothetical protein
MASQGMQTASNPSGAVLVCGLVRLGKLVRCASRPEGSLRRR